MNNNDYYPEVHPFEDMDVEGLIDYGDCVLPQQQKQLVPKSPSYKETLQGSFKRKKNKYMLIEYFRQEYLETEVNHYF